MNEDSPYSSYNLDHLGLIAGIVDELGLPGVIDTVIKQRSSAWGSPAKSGTYSRDHRPDLNQVILQLISEHQAGIPLWMDALSGNSSDKASFREMHIPGKRGGGAECRLKHLKGELPTLNHLVFFVVNLTISTC